MHYWNVWIRKKKKIQSSIFPYTSHFYLSLLKQISHFCLDLCLRLWTMGWTFDRFVPGKTKDPLQQEFKCQRCPNVVHLLIIYSKAKSNLASVPCDAPSRCGHVETWTASKTWSTCFPKHKTNNVQWSKTTVLSRPCYISSWKTNCKKTNKAEHQILSLEWVSAGVCREWWPDTRATSLNAPSADVLVASLCKFAQLCGFFFYRAAKKKVRVDVCSRGNASRRRNIKIWGQIHPFTAVCVGLVLVSSCWLCPWFIWQLRQWAAVPQSLRSQGWGWGSTIWRTTRGRCSGDHLTENSCPRSMESFLLPLNRWKNVLLASCLLVL